MRVRKALKRTQRHSESPHCFIVDLVLWLSEHRGIHEARAWSLICFESQVATSNCVQKSQCVRQYVEITFEKEALTKDSTIIVVIKLSANRGWCFAVMPGLL